MTYPVLARASEALTDDETVALLRDRLDDGVVDHVTEFGDLTVIVTPVAWHAAAAACRDESLLAFDMFDCLFGVDAGDEGLDVVAVLYSTSKGRRIMLRGRCDGGRETPTMPTITDLYRGADWMEREAFDMFGINFEGHPGLLPRILSVENFEGWPLRKDFALSSRVAKPWPGVKEPAETDDEGNVIVREPAIGEAAGPSGLDEVIARQAREANAPPEEETPAVEDGGEQAAEPEREEVDLDQETFDRLIAEGKSERIARSKAKAAFIKKQRAAAAGASDADAGAPATPSSGDDAERAGTAEPPVDDDAAAAASAKADAAREQQARAREERAGEQAAADGAGDTEDGDLAGIPEGTPPPDDGEPADRRDDEEGQP